MALKKKRPTWIPVATALIRREGKILLGRRPEGNSLAGYWEFPGGKIEMGESPEEALQRELQEELGIEAVVGPLRLSATHSYNGTGIVLLFFEVQYWKGEVKAVHHGELQWVKPEELKNLSLPDANVKVLDKILQVLD
jgi:8-oxo-dGTP diphosphatase